MKHCENAHVMQCMSIHDHLNKTQHKNFAKTSSFLKPQKFRTKSMKCMIREGKQDHTRERKVNLGRKSSGFEV